MKEFDKLLSIAKRKATFDDNNSWTSGSTTYLTEIKNEVDEVIEEIPKSRKCYLEDELGDVLWDYLNVLTTPQVTFLSSLDMEGILWLMQPTPTENPRAS